MQLPSCFKRDGFLYFYKMKIFLALFVFTLIYSGCQSSAIKQSFSSADSLVIHFKDEQAGIVTKTIETAEAKAISNVINFIDGAGIEESKCGYDGKMYFYNRGQKIQEVDFNMKADSCTHFSFLLDGKLVNTKLSNEAVDFFDALEKGMPYY